jgi:hypothetical protein
VSGLLAGKVWLSDLPRNLKPLAATLADIANDDGTSIYPSVEYVAWRLSSSHRAVRAGLSELRDSGVLELLSAARPDGSPAGGRTLMAEYRMIEAKLPRREPWRGKHENSACFTKRKPAKNDAKACKKRRERVKKTAETANVSLRKRQRPVSEPPCGNLFAAAQRGDPRRQPFVKFAHELYLAKRGQSPTWSGVQYKNLKDLLKRAPTASLAELQRRFSNYLASGEPFIVRNGYSLSVFCMRYDALCDGPIFQEGGTGAEQQTLNNLKAAGFVQ